MINRIKCFAPVPVSEWGLFKNFRIIEGISILFLICSLAGCLSGCTKNTAPLSKTDFVMDTVATITIFDGPDESGGEELLNESFNEIRRYERLFSAEIPDSDVSRINRSRGERVDINFETAELLKTALRYCELSDGAFDITIRPVSKLWDFKSGQCRIPDESSISEALKHVGYENIILDEVEYAVSLKDPDSEIDLGAVAKGYTADRIKEYLLDRGVTSAIINLGGNVLLIGSKRDGSPFKIGIEKPFSKEGEMIKTLSEKDVSIVTSGNYERCFEKDGKLYHHILDTETGYPVESGLNAVTIVSGKSVDGDALSTICFCLGKERAEELLNRLDGEDTKSYYINDKNELLF